MKIVKKDFTVQEFDIKKIEKSIIGASEDAGNLLTVSDVKNISENIYNDILKMREDKTSVYEVFALTLAHLQNEGFKKIAKYYYDGKSQG